jgi:hypothetical protein
MRTLFVRRGPLAAAGAAVALALLVTGCSGDEEPAAGGTSATDGSGSGAAAGSPTGSASGGPAGSAAGTPAGSGTGTPPVPPPGSATGTGSRTPGPPARVTSGPPVAVSPLPPVPVGRGSTLLPGVEVAMVKVAEVRVEASGPGEVAGPGVAVTIRVRDTSTKAFDLDGLAVNAAYGANVPANPGGSARATPLQGQLAPGKSAEGTYYFLVPSGQSRNLRVEVSSSSSPSIAVFRR